jgi:hypothetical protein
MVGVLLAIVFKLWQPLKQNRIVVSLKAWLLGKLSGFALQWQYIQLFG